MDFVLDLKEAAKFLKYGFGAGGHESTGDHTCGSHLCSIASDGSVSKCGFFENEPAGNVNDLGSAWENICKSSLPRLDELECKDCAVLHECKGGCRFRAKQFKGILAPDPLMCCSHMTSSNKGQDALQIVTPARCLKDGEAFQPGIF